MRNRILSSILIVFIFFAEAASQQTRTNPDTTELMSIVLDEIVVKASKDNVTFKSLPASVSIISSKKIAESEIKDRKSVV